MRQTVLAGVLLGVMVSGVAAQRQISLLATITDPSGAEVTAIDPTDVRVTENSAPATVLKVEPVNRVPKVQLLIDNGIGMPAESIGDLRKGVRGLLEALPPDIEVTVVSTAPQPRFIERATTDRDKILAAVDRLAPDTGAGRFVESLAEATQRIERDKQPDANYTIIAVGTSSGDVSVRERDIQQIQERVAKFRTTVHVTILTAVSRSASNGVIQGELGQAVAKQTGGRFENIAVANRLASLLPEIGGQVGKNLGAGSRQFRITVERPSGASGDLGQMGMGVVGKTLASVAIESR